MEGLKEKTAKGLFWGGISNGIQQILGLVFGIWLARLLSVDDYGLIGMLAIFTSVASSLQQGGFIATLTNRKEVSHEDYNAVFWFNTGVGLLIYIILFFSAPLIARLFGRPELILLSRVVFLGFLIGSFGTVPVAYMFRNLMVKERTVIELISQTTAGVASLIFALNGWGYWGLAIQSVLNMALGTLLRWVWTGWHPTFSLNIKPLKEMLPSGLPLMFTEIFTKISENILPVMLGRSFTGTEVGYFTQGNKWMNMGRAVTSGMITGVAQPVFVLVNSEKERRLQVLRKLTRFIAFISFPCMFGLAFISPEFIVLAITDKWLPSVPLLQMLCIWGAFYPISDIYRGLVVSAGYTRLYMHTTIWFGILQFLLIWYFVSYGVIIMTAVYVGSYFIYLLLWQFLSGRILPLRWWYILQDIAPYIIITLGVMGGVWYIIQPVTGLWLRLFLKILLVTVFYTGIVWKSKSVIFRESVEYIIKWKNNLLRKNDK